MFILSPISLTTRTLLPGGGGGTSFSILTAPVVVYDLLY